MVSVSVGLAGVAKETYTGEGPVSYWNKYVAVTQMGGHGSFSDPRLGIKIVQTPDLVQRKLPALRDYQISLAAPTPPAGSFDATAAQRGRAVFDGGGRCSSCHEGQLRTEADLHPPSDAGTDPTTASRSATKRYRVTPLRALFQHPPYFHDGSARTLRAVVDHYVTVMGLNLTEGQKTDLVEYLKSI